MSLYGISGIRLRARRAPQFHLARDQGGVPPRVQGRGAQHAGFQEACGLQARNMQGQPGSTRASQACPHMLFLSLAQVCTCRGGVDLQLERTLRKPGQEE
jgi:hypothetical protein